MAHIRGKFSGGNLIYIYLCLWPFFFPLLEMVKYIWPVWSHWPGTGEARQKKRRFPKATWALRFYLELFDLSFLSTSLYQYIDIVLDINIDMVACHSWKSWYWIRTFIEILISMHEDINHNQYRYDHSWKTKRYWFRKLYRQGGENSPTWALFTAALVFLNQ